MRRLAAIAILTVQALTPGPARADELCAGELCAGALECRAIAAITPDGSRFEESHAKAAPGRFDEDWADNRAEITFLGLFGGIGPGSDTVCEVWDYGHRRSCGRADLAGTWFVGPATFAHIRTGHVIACVTPEGTTYVSTEVHGVFVNNGFLFPIEVDDAIGPDHEIEAGPSDIRARQTEVTPGSCPRVSARALHIHVGERSTTLGFVSVGFC